MPQFTEPLESRRLLSATSVIRPAPELASAAFVGPVRPAVTRVAPVTPLVANYNGTVFQDNNGDALYSSGDTFLPNKVVFNDANDNGLLDAGEPSATSSTIDGRYTITNVAAGQPRRLRLTDASRSGFVATTPVVSGTTVDGTFTQNFGLFPTFVNLPFIGSTTFSRLRLSADGTRIELTINSPLGTAAYSVPKNLLSSFSIFGNSSDDDLLLDLTNGNAFGATLNFYGQTSAINGDRVSVLAAAGGSSVTIGTSSIFAGSTTLNYQTVERLAFTGSAKSDSVILVGATLSEYTGGGGNDFVDMLGGTFAPTANIGSDNSNVAISAAFSGTVRFVTPQNLAGLTLNGNSTATVQTSGATLRVGALSINAAGGASLNLNANSMIVDYTDASPLDTIRSYLASGLTSGSGIRSGTAAANGRRLGYGEARLAQNLGPAMTGSFIGQPVDATTVLVRYTFAGDADLDGGVSINDFNRLSANFGKPAGRYWTDGDFDLDGGTSIDDFNQMSANFGKTA